MSWLSKFIHNPGQFITHEPAKALALLAAPLAAVAAPFALPELGAAFGVGGATALGEGALIGGGEAAAAGLGAEGLALGGDAALGLGTVGSEALAFAPEAAGSIFPGGSLLPEAIPSGFLEAGAGTPASFYDAVGFGAGAGPVSTAGTTIPDAIAPIASSTSAIAPEMAAGAPFADSAVGQAMINAGLVDPAAAASSGMWGSAMNWIKANPLMAASLGIGGASLLARGASNLIGGLPNEKQLKGVAGQAGQMASTLNAQGQGLMGPIEGGPLPGPLEQSVVNGLNDANAATKSRFAALGLSGSTMETDALSHNANQAQALRGTLALQLAQAGSQLISLANADLGIEAGVFQNLMNAQIAQDNALEQAIAGFAGQAAMASAISSRPTVSVRAA